MRCAVSCVTTCIPPRGSSYLLPHHPHMLPRVSRRVYAYMNTYTVQYMNVARVVGRSLREIPSFQLPFHTGVSYGVMKRTRRRDYPRVSTERVFIAPSTRPSTRATSSQCPKHGDVKRRTCFRERSDENVVSRIGGSMLPRCCIRVVLHLPQ